jgi:hypothetical protein
MEKRMFKKFTDYVSDRKKGPSVKQEYLDDQGRLVEKPKVKVVADYDGPDPKSPPKAKGAEDNTPYRCANSAEKPKKGENGFADLGDKKLVYDPDTKPGTSKMTSLGKEVGEDWPKTKTEAFIAQTKNMSSSEFAKYMLESCACNTENLPTVTSYKAGQFHPHPSEAIRYVAAIAAENIKFMENLVYEMKKAGNLTALLAVMLEHRDTYTALTDLFEDEEFGPTRAKFFARALSEAVGPPMGLGHEDEEEEAEPPFGDEGEEAVPPEEDMGDEAPEDEGGAEEDMPPEDEEMGDEGEEEHDPLADDSDDDEHPLDKIGKPKKKFNLGSAMGSFESVKHALRKYLN